MSETDTIPLLLEEWKEGLFTDIEVYAKIFRLLTLDNVEDVIANLPAEVATPFIEWARKNYDNTADPSNFVVIGGEVTEDVHVEAIAAIRAWFAARRGT